MVTEICCGGYEDALLSMDGGADRIELNSALFMGGLTPGIGTLRLVKRDTGLPVCAMVRPRGGGFCYSEAEFLSMLADAEELLKAGADGIVFGFLRADGAIDEERTAKMTELAHRYGRESVFHRAFDCTGATKEALEILIRLGVDRVLTSGGKLTAAEGAEQIRALHRAADGRIEILAGGGVNERNAAALIENTGISQLHSSCREWRADPTTEGRTISYNYAGDGHRGMYDAVSGEKVERLVSAVESR
ncbi:copper homeostasis protein CutC [Lachnoclostridium sp. Marseille-P6806]|uniref:copper homeostasis protein CutC n=1 Tax=Lachnoclostridium sp. Marseille-P6806 TaxID=2364793 RepID=UPI0010324ED3|nr:copper homeostasis protein CutC [Lachnoclostridium sp. Marseille-P6806]